MDFLTVARRYVNATPTAILGPATPEPTEIPTVLTGELDPPLSPEEERLVYGSRESHDRTGGCRK